MGKRVTRLAAVLALASSAVLTPVTAMAGQTRSEILADAGVNTVLGIATVFIMLIVIALVIYCFKFINAFANKSAKATEAAKPAVAAAPAPAAIASGADEELAAAIAAAIAAAENIPVNSFRITSITQR